ncbi:sulfurtransferase complex subunit TusB [Candidatus Pacearchaeota archaeon]|nr:sulfurtransferase complex subunit TusB [Candidatus Pacearchaeota archaeon]
MLHIINKSPTNSPALKQCLKRAQQGSSILLMEDAAYALISKTEASSQIKQHMNRVSFYVLEPDIKARGIGEKIISGIQRIGYNDFVKLACSQHPVQSWF